ncbi:MAG TPA: LLM class flavin-dependent oxidoreductase [Candidatus Elarobacter sp.]|nr:LLM class flavin-dependent oxidoreductase [Candidatus Elarobacter sp.]
MIPFSVLDLAPVVQGGDVAHALRNSLALARHAERLGYRRFWLAEHHGMPGIASAATAVVIGYVAGGTSTIHVGAGGIMLPNHAPLVIAEQFGTLEALYPGRIDLGLGRAPGSDRATIRALRRHEMAAETFPSDVVELMRYFHPEPGDDAVRAVPGAGLDVPIWILGSSLFGAQLAAALGLPYAFASHFAPAQLLEAADLYRREFRPSAQSSQPYLMVGVNVVAADSDVEARRLFTSLQQAFANIRRGRRTNLPPPVDDIERRLDPIDWHGLHQMLSYSVVGSPETVRHGLEQVIAQTDADEIIIASQIFDHAARVRSYEIAAAVRESLDTSLTSPRDVRDLLRTDTSHS